VIPGHVKRQTLAGHWSLQKVDYRSNLLGLPTEVPGAADTGQPAPGTLGAELHSLPFPDTSELGALP